MLILSEIHTETLLFRTFSQVLLPQLLPTVGSCVIPDRGAVTESLLLHSKTNLTTYFAETFLLKSGCVSHKRFELMLQSLRTEMHTESESVSHTKDQHFQLVLLASTLTSGWSALSFSRLVSLSFFLPSFLSSSKFRLVKW